MNLICNHKCSYMKETEEDFTTEGTGDVMMEARRWRVQGSVIIQGMQEAPGSWRKQGKISSLQPPREISLGDIYFLPFCVAYGILVPQQGIKPMSPAVEAWSLNH